MYYTFILQRDVQPRTSLMAVAMGASRFKYIAEMILQQVRGSEDTAFVSPDCEENKSLASLSFIFHWIEDSSVAGQLVVQHSTLG